MHAISRRLDMPCKDGRNHHRAWELPFCTLLHIREGSDGHFAMYAHVAVWPRLPLSLSLSVV